MEFIRSRFLRVPVIFAGVFGRSYYKKKKKKCTVFAYTTIIILFFTIYDIFIMIVNKRFEQRSCYGDVPVPNKIPEIFISETSEMVYANNTIWTDARTRGYNIILKSIDYYINRKNNTMPPAPARLTATTPARKSSILMGHYIIIRTRYNQIYPVYRIRGTII